MFYYAFAEQLHKRNATMWNNMGKTYQETIAEIQKSIAEQERIIAKTREDKNRISEAIRKNKEKKEPTPNTKAMAIIEKIKKRNAADLFSNNTQEDPPNQ